MTKISLSVCAGLALGALALIASCALQPTTPPPASASTASAPAAATAANGQCKVQAASICAAVRDRKVRFGGTGLSGNLSYQSQNSLATEQEIWHFQIPKGSRFDVQCEINTSLRKVVYASVLPGPALSASDNEWLNKAGLCAGQSLAISKAKLESHITSGEVP